MKELEVREKLRNYIVKELIRDLEYELKDDEGIITGGLMDSFALAELSVYIEGEFDVYIPDPELRSLRWTHWTQWFPGHASI